MSDAKPISLPSHLWSALDQMAGEMGVGRDQLVAQAVFTLARLNGYLVPGKVHVASGGPPRLDAAPAPAPARGAPPAAKPASAPPGMRGRNAPPPEEFEEEEPVDEEPIDEPQDDQPEDDLPQEEPEEPVDDDPPPEEEEEEEPAPAPRGGGKAMLTLFVTNRDPFKMPSDSMTIGRGKSCDLVIDSNRVSREHARISREGADFIFEDLNSSNGSFFGPQKEKITARRKIKDGDEITLGTEKVKFSIRK